MDFTYAGHFGKDVFGNRELMQGIKNKKLFGAELDIHHPHNQEFPKVSPKFGNSGRTRNGQQTVSQGGKARRLYPSSTKNCFNNQKENSFSTAKRHENTMHKSKHGNEISNSMLIERNEETVVKDCMNKSYEYRRRNHGHRHLGGHRALYESNNSRIPLDEAKKSEYNTRNKTEICFSKEARTEGPIEAWKDRNEHEERALRVEVELKRIKKDPSSRNKIHSLFEEIIGCDQYYGRALKQIKEFYEWKICQLNERIGRHDMKCKEYKSGMEKHKKLREEKERKLELAKAEIQRQAEFIETQKEIINNLKGKIENTPNPIFNPIFNPNTKGSVKDRVVVSEKVTIPRLDLSRLRNDMKAKEHKEGFVGWDGNKVKNWKGGNDKSNEENKQSNESIEVITFKDNFIQ